MAFVVKKGLISSQDVKWYTAASPTFYRGTSTGSGTNITSVAATHIPLSNATAGYWTVNNVERALNEAGGAINSAQATIQSHTTQFTNAHATIASHTTQFTNAHATIASAAATIDQLNAASLNWAYWYRTNKPTLSHTLYGATRVLSCYGSADAPSEVMISGVVYRNKGTILADFSRTKTPATATVCGLERGPAIATYAHYVYAVPTPAGRLSATRQWDLVVSKQSPATGPLAAATYPSWSFLGAAGMMTNGMMPFVQTGDQVRFNRSVAPIFSDPAPTNYRATYGAMTAKNLPTGAGEAIVRLSSYVAAAVSHCGGHFRAQDGNLLTIAAATADFAFSAETDYHAFGAGILASNRIDLVSNVGLSPSGYFGRRYGGVNVASATHLSVYLDLCGFVLKRSKWK